MNPKVFHQNDQELNQYFNAVKYWSNALGELHHRGAESLAEKELPDQLRHAYDNLFFQGEIGSVRYLVETERGYGIALCNEYDQCYADDCGVSPDDLFLAVKEDAAAIAADPLFANAEIIVGEHMGFDNSHDLTVIFPADISADEFMKAAAKLDTLVYQSAKTLFPPTVSMDTAGLRVDGHVGTWHTIDHVEVEGHTFWLMEHDQYGDNARCIIVDSHGKTALSDVVNGFDEHTIDLLKQAVTPVPQMPDRLISTQEMQEYGYCWAGMLPMREGAAAEVMQFCTIYRLYNDDTEGMVMDAAELRPHAAQGGIFGVEKVDWLAHLAKEREMLSAAKLNQMLIDMINTYTDAVYGTSGDYETVKKDIMSAVGMSEEHFESIKNDLDFVHHCNDRSIKPSLEDQIGSASARAAGTQAKEKDPTPER